jgi:putative NADPH-quinone reductase
VPKRDAAALDLAQPSVRTTASRIFVVDTSPFPMVSTRVLLIQGHPDAGAPHFCHALADAYAEGASAAGHGVERVDVAALDFPLLRSKADWDHGAVPAGLEAAQQAILHAQHMALFFPLWLGGMPALLKGFLEQVARPGFALSRPDAQGRQSKLLGGRSTRVVVTMGMPALVYRWYFRAHSLKALERNILGFIGFGPIRETLVGSVEGQSDDARQQWLGKLAALGRRAA